MPKKFFFFKKRHPYRSSPPISYHSLYWNKVHKWNNSFPCRKYKDIFLENNDLVLFPCTQVKFNKQQLVNISCQNKQLKSYILYVLRLRIWHTATSSNIGLLRLQFKLCPCRGASCTTIDMSTRCFFRYIVCAEWIFL